MQDCRSKAARLAAVVVGGFCVLSAPVRAQQADVSDLLQCRRLPVDAERYACLDRVSAAIAASLEPDERGMSNPATAAERPIERTPMRSPPTARSARSTPTEFVLAIQRLDYEDGKPLFTLENGEVWISEVARRLTSRPEGNLATLNRTPVGYLLHFNGSRFALPVRRRR